MLWVILIILIIAGLITNNFTPLKLFGKIVAWFFGIILALLIICVCIMRINAADEEKQAKAYWEEVKKTPLVQWACDADGYQLYLGERPSHVFQCSTGRLVATKEGVGYICVAYGVKSVNHWKHCAHPSPSKGTKYDNLY